MVSMKRPEIRNILQLLFLFLENDSQMKTQTSVEIAALHEFQDSPVTFHAITLCPKPELKTQMKSRLQEPSREPKHAYKIVPHLHSVKLAWKLASFGLVATVPDTLQVGLKATRRIDGHNANSWAAPPCCTCPSCSCISG